ncbi:MAG: internal scaffolding protein [Microvirus sp.]|nr:MAG: internal scaffolding protein [Microvirus sp.]
MATASLGKRLIRTPYGHRLIPFDRHFRHKVDVSGPTQVDQSQGAECDINNIVLRYKTTGTLPVRLNHREPEFLDVSEVPDLQTALNLVSQGQEILSALRQAATDRENSSVENSLALPPGPDPVPAPPVSSPSGSPQP